MVERKKTTRAKLGVNLLSFVSGEVEIKESVIGDNLLRNGDKLAIRVCNGKYIQTDINNNNIICGDGNSISEWELFRISLTDDAFASNNEQVIKYGDEVAFLSLVNDCFVGTDLENLNELTARVKWVKAWESFTICCPPDKKLPLDKKLHFGSWFALKANNGNYVIFDRDGSKMLLASAPEIKEWECFVAMSPNESMKLRVI